MQAWPYPLLTRETAIALEPDKTEKPLVKTLIIVIAVVTGLLSIAAGFAKATLAPQEVGFLGPFGLSNSLIVSFGLVQIVGGLLMLIPKTRFPGSLLATATFAISVVFVLMGGNLGFAAISLIPLALTGWVALQTKSATN